jgi:O-antigen/teichoic acid export membrane protein
MNLKFFTFFLKKNNKGKVSRNTTYLFASEIILKVLGVLWIIFLARSLSISNFGIYNIVTSFIAIFSFLPDFGVGIIIIREIASNKNRVSKLLGAALALNTALAVATFLISLITSVLLGYSSFIIALIAISALTLVISTVRSVAIFYLK